ncbi:MAG: hypothetical protein AMXMBFR56_18790 [Polyangiaceae bacterium]
MHCLVRCASLLLALLSGCAGDGAPAGQSSEDAAAPTDPACSESAVFSRLLDGSCVTGAVCDIRVQFQCEPGVKYVTGLREYACSCPSGAWECTFTGGSLSLNSCPDAGAD